MNEILVDGLEEPFESADDESVVRVREGVYSVITGGKQFLVNVESLGDGRYRARTGDSSFEIEVVDPRRLSRLGHGLSAQGPQAVKAPMPGKVVDLAVVVGDEVEAGMGVVTVEAMKMQNELKAPRAGKVAEVRVGVGDSVAVNEALVVID